MTHLAPQIALPARPVAPGIAALQNAVLWLVGASGAIVFIEPSPYELATLAALIVFFATGLKLRPIFLMPIVLLLLLNLGYTISAIPVFEEKIPTWVATSWYLAITAIFFAMVLAEDTANRVDYLLRGYVVGAIIAAAAAVAGYFGLVPGGRDLLTLYGRARGTFKDPNVLGAFLLLPALVTLQSVLTERLGKALRSALAFLLISIAILLSFSRAAWGTLALSSMIMITLMMVINRRQRSRIILLTCLAGAGAVLLISILLSLDSVGDLFKERATLSQGYDGGRFGRFGRYSLGAEMALGYPLGIGPLQFTKFFPEDTHNSFLNAFMSGGWLSGVCYLTLISTTIIYGVRYMFADVPWRMAYLTVFTAFFATAAEGFIIDTDHWRHLFLLIGATWGLIAANRIHLASHPAIHSAAYPVVYSAGQPAAFRSG